MKQTPAGTGEFGPLLGRLHRELPEPDADALYALLLRLNDLLDTVQRESRLARRSPPALVRRTQDVLNLVIDEVNRPPSAEAEEQSPPVPVEPAPEESPDLSERAQAEAQRRIWEWSVADPELRYYAEAYRPAAADGIGAAAGWQRLLCLRLRLSDGQVERLRRAAEARTAEVAARHGVDLQVPAGVWTGRDLWSREDLAEFTGPDPAGPWAELAELAASAVWLAEHDPAVRFGYQTNAPVKELFAATAEEVRFYRNSLSARMSALHGAEPGTDAQSVRLAEADELIRGLVPLPFPAAGSWWDRRIRRLDEIFKSVTGTAPPRPGLPYGDVRNRMTAEYSFPLAASGSPSALPPGMGPGLIVWILWAGLPCHHDRSRRTSRVIYLKDD